MSDKTASAVSQYHQELLGVFTLGIYYMEVAWEEESGAYRVVEGNRVEGNLLLRKLRAPDAEVLVASQLCGGYQKDEAPTLFDYLSRVGRITPAPPDWAKDVMRAQGMTFPGDPEPKVPEESSPEPEPQATPKLPGAYAPVIDRAAIEANIEKAAQTLASKLATFPVTELEARREALQTQLEVFDEDALFPSEGETPPQMQAMLRAYVAARVQLRAIETALEK